MTWKNKVAALTLSFSVLCALNTLDAVPAPKRPQITRIAQVTIFSTDLSEARAFYTKTLGVAAGRVCNWCELPPDNTFLLNPRQSASLAGAPDPVPPNLLGEITLATEDLGKLSKYLKAQGVQTVPKLTTDHHWDMISVGYSTLSAIDPEGRRISFIGRTNPSLPSGSAPATLPLNALHLLHAGFIVHDRAATEHFYKDILGFRPYWHGGMKDDQTDWVSLQVPDGTDWIEMMVNVPPDADQRLRGIMNHIAIGVADIHETEKRLEAAGVTLTEQPKIGRDGKWQLNLYDPDLTRIEFMEFTPVQKPCCSAFTGPHPQP